MNAGHAHGYVPRHVMSTTSTVSRGGSPGHSRTPQETRSAKPEQYQSRSLNGQGSGEPEAQNGTFPGKRQGRTPPDGCSYGDILSFARCLADHRRPHPELPIGCYTRPAHCMCMKEKSLVHIAGSRGQIRGKWCASGVATAPPRLQYLPHLPLSICQPI